MSDSSSQSELLSVEETAAECFTLWTPSHVASTFRNHKQNLTQFSKQLLKLCFAGSKVNFRSCYLSNEKMMETLESFDEWNPCILTGDVCLHMKFKTSAGRLAHINKYINL